MGRHSIPDPEESSERSPRGRQRCDRVVRPAAGPARRLPSGPPAGPPEPDYPRYGEPITTNPPTAAGYPSREYRTNTRVPRAGYESRSSRPSTTRITTTRVRLPGVGLSRDTPSPEYLQAGYRDPETAEPDSVARREHRVRRAHAEPKPPPRAAALRRMGRRRMDRQPPRHPTGPPGRQLGRHRRSGRSRRGGGGFHPVALLR